MTDRKGQWLGVAELAEEIGIPVRTLYAWHSRGTGGPRAAKLGRHLKYRRSDVETWLESRLDRAGDHPRPAA